jgi:hypothetical protein
MPAEPQKVPFGEWTPDRSDRNNPACEAKGVVSIAGQYAPFKDFQEYNGADAASDAEAVGGGMFNDSTNVPHIYLGDASKLYHLESRAAVDRSQMGGYSIGSSGSWGFAQFGDKVVAVGDATAPQVHDMSDPTTAFADLTEAPSGATSVARVNDFLFMGVDYTAHWSAFNNIFEWTPDDATQAGNQELDQEHGVIQQIVGLDYAAIFQERAIRRANYVGPPIKFDFGQDAVEKERGSISRRAAAPWGRNIFYMAEDGAYMFDGQSSTPIGIGKVDEYFQRRLNYPYRHKIQTACVNKRFVVGFPAGAATNISELLIFNMQDGRWTHDEIDLELIFKAAPELVTVDTFALLYPGDDLDATVIVPDDIDSAVWDDARRQLGGVNTSHRFGLFSGTNRPAIVETPEFEPMPGRRARVTELWPLGDVPASAIACSVGYRRALPDVGIAYTAATAVNRVGYCPQRIDARFMRGRQQVTAGVVWSRLEGLHYTARLTGKR